LNSVQWATRRAKMQLLEVKEQCDYVKWDSLARRAKGCVELERDILRVDFLIGVDLRGEELLIGEAKMV
jgi:hypothetical protein